MKNELDTINPIQSLANIEYYPAIQDVNLPMEKTTKIPLSQINNLGVAFQPLTTVIQTAINGTGGSGIYFVNTHGKSMFQSKRLIFDRIYKIEDSFLLQISINKNTLTTLSSQSALTIHI